LDLDDPADKSFKPRKTPPTSEESTEDSDVVAIKKPPQKAKQKEKTVSPCCSEAFCHSLSMCAGGVCNWSHKTNKKEIKGIQNIPSVGKALTLLSICSLTTMTNLYQIRNIC
jgi:hypothetical protein